MVKVTIYTRNWCGYCFRAKRLLEAKGVDFEEIDVDVDFSREKEMIQRSGGKLTVPQVFIDGRHVGGSDELHDLERRGELDRLLGFQS
jgi:glutaredoxin 3